MVSLFDQLNINVPISGPPVETVISCLVLSFLLGLIISLVYKMTNRGFSYEGGFNLTLIFVCIIVTSIMITIGSNIALSLGLIGSLSIIRFRTVLKNTVDMAFLFWSIAVGLSVGAQNYNMAIGVVVFISLVQFIIHKFNIFLKTNTDFILVVQMQANEHSEDTKGIVSGILNMECSAWKIKSGYVDNIAKTQEITYSIYSRKFKNFDQLLGKLQEISEVDKVSLLSPETNLFI